MRKRTDNRNLRLLLVVAAFVMTFFVMSIGLLLNLGVLKADVNGTNNDTNSSFIASENSTFSFDTPLAGDDLVPVEPMPAYPLASLSTSKEFYPVSEPVLITVTSNLSIGEALVKLYTPLGYFDWFTIVDFTQNLSSYGFVYEKESNIPLGNYTLELLVDNVLVDSHMFEIGFIEENFSLPTAPVSVLGIITDYDNKSLDVTLFAKEVSDIGPLTNRETLAPGQYDLYLTMNSSLISSITVKDAHITGNISALFEIDHALDASLYNEQKFDRMYAINPKINYTSADVTLTAVSNVLFKCAAWNFTDRSCGGEWVKIMDLVPGQDYTFTMTPADPGFGEGNITILTVQSYPTVGGNWTVAFNTTGTANLTITAVDGTAWSDTDEDNDLKFLEVRCGDAVLEYAWIDNGPENSSVFIEDYSCSQAAFETSKVLTSGKHTLMFRFGDEVAYAYNDASNWWSTSWLRRRNINVTNVGTSSLSNFPVFLNITNVTGMHGNYKDVRFLSGSCYGAHSQVLPYEIDTARSAYALFWVQVPTLGTGNTAICMYYDNAAVPDGQNKTGTWDSNFAMVLHMADRTTSIINDSTSNAHHGTKASANNPQELATGRIGRQQDFSSDTISNGNVDEVTTSYTAEAWIRTDTVAAGSGDVSTYGRTIMASATNGQGYPLWLATRASEVRFWAWTAGSTNYSTTTGLALTTTTHYHVVGRATQNGNATIFVNGRPWVTTTSGNNAWTNTFTLGDLRPTRAIYFDGKIDELRVSNTLRSNNWINMSYQLVANHNSFVSYGSIDVLVPPQTPIVNLTSVDGSNETHADLNCSAVLLDDNNFPINVSVRWYNNTVLWLSKDYNNNYANGTVFSALLGAGNTSVGQNWTCSLRLYDGLFYSNWSNSTTLTIIDATPPTWSDAKTYPLTGVTYAPGLAYQFNITWVDEGIGLDTVLFEHNFTGTLDNSTASGNSSSEYYYGLANLSAGTYVWRSYANDSYNLVNRSTQWTYLISKANPVLSLAADPFWIVGIGTQTNITCSAVSTQVNISLYRNGTYINSSIGSEVSDVAILGGGTFNYTCNTTGNQNYTASEISSNLIVTSKIVSLCNLSFDPLSGQTYPVSFNASCACGNPEAPAMLWRDGIDVTSENNEFVQLAVGSYDYMCNVSETENYSYGFNNSMYLININVSTMNLSINGSESDYSLNVSFNTNLTCAISTPSAFVNLTEDSIELLSGIAPLTYLRNYTSPGSHVINCSYEGNENYTAVSAQYTITAVEDEPPAVTLESPDDGYLIPAFHLVNVSFSCSATDNYLLQNLSLWITDSLNQSFGLNQSLAVGGQSNASNWTLELVPGNYTWNCQAYDFYNHTGWAANRSLTINYTAPILNISLYSPASSTNVTKDRFFSFTVNVSCSGISCGGLNVYLDPTVNWWNTTFIKRLEINITNIGSTTLLNFPAYLNISYNDSMRPDYHDLRFVNGSCIEGDAAELSYEVENFTAGNAHVWVKVPKLVPGINSLCMYYNNSQAADGQDAASVWDEHYLGVYHMTLDGTAVKDSTDRNNGTNNGAALDTATPLGPGLLFVEAQNDYVDLGAFNDYEGQTNVTFESYFSLDSIDDNMLFAKADTYSPLIWADAAATPSSRVNTFSIAVDSGPGADDRLNGESNVLNDNRWHYLSIVFDGSNTRFLAYLDGREDANSPTAMSYSTFPTSTANLRIGDWETNGGYEMDGTITEARISNISRSKDWTNQTYQMIVNPATTVAYGEPESSTLKGLIPAVPGATPFWTNESNPKTIVLGEGESQLVTFWVNASGAINSTYEFFAYAILSDDSSITDQTTSINITITPDVTPPTVILSEPSDGYTLLVSVPVNVTFTCDVTDDSLLKNVSLYITNSSNQSFSFNTSTNVGGFSNSSSWNLTLDAGAYTWNCLSYDNASNFAWAIANYSLLLSQSQAGLPANITVSKTILYTDLFLFTVSLNVTNLDADNVSIISVYDYVPSGFNATLFNVQPDETNSSVSGIYAGGYTLSWLIDNLTANQSYYINYTLNMTGTYADTEKIAMVGIDPVVAADDALPIGSPLLDEGQSQKDSEEGTQSVLLFVLLMVLLFLALLWKKRKPSAADFFQRKIRTSRRRRTLQKKQSVSARDQSVLLLFFLLSLPLLSLFGRYSALLPSASLPYSIFSFFVSGNSPDKKLGNIESENIRKTFPWRWNEWTKHD